jgi:hypothetical protein
MIKKGCPDQSRPTVNDRIPINYVAQEIHGGGGRGRGSAPIGFLSDSHRSDSDPDFVGIRRNRIKIRPDPTRILSCSVEFRWNPTRIRSKTTGSIGRIESPSQNLKCKKAGKMIENLNNYNGEKLTQIALKNAWLLRIKMINLTKIKWFNITQK